jgi:hypothetical protein
VNCSTFPYTAALPAAVTHSSEPYRRPRTIMAPATAPQVSPVRIPLANPDAIRTAVSLDIPSPFPQAARTACAQAKPSSMS